MHNVHICSLLPGNTSKRWYMRLSEWVSRDVDVHSFIQQMFVEYVPGIVLVPNQMVYLFQNKPNSRTGIFPSVLYFLPFIWDFTVGITNIYHWHPSTLPSPNLSHCWLNNIIACFLACFPTFKCHLLFKSWLDKLSLKWVTEEHDLGSDTMLGWSGVKITLSQESFTPVGKARDIPETITFPQKSQTPPGHSVGLPFWPPCGEMGPCDKFNVTFRPTT